MKKFFRAFFIMALATVGIYFSYLYLEDQNRVEYVEVEKEVPVEVEKEITSEIIKDGLNQIGELATEEYYFTEVESVNSVKTFKNHKIPFTESGYVYSYDGTIKAGIDFTQVEVEKDEESKILNIYLPQAKVLSTEIDTDSFEVYDEKQSIVNNIGVEDFNESLDELKENATNKALNKGVLGKASENACSIIESFVSNTYSLEEYAIQIYIR